MKNAVLLTLAFTLLTPSAKVHAQSTFADFESQEKVASSEVDKFKAALNGEDSARALRAMQFMIQSSDPNLANAAKEFGLYSTNAIVQKEAIASIFNTGGPFRIVVDLTNVDDNKAGIGKYINRIGGAHTTDKSSVSWTFLVEPYSEEKDCWQFKGEDNCAFILVGTSVSLQGWNGGIGSLNLNDSGQLSGSLASRSLRYPIPAPATISLLD